MVVSEVCSTVDAIRAFLEHFVDPMLQQIPSVPDDPPLSLQHKVAKQVHSVVLLYNYYHRKQNPELEFVAFKEFCKLIVDLRPDLLPYMKFTRTSVEADLVDVEQQLSLTEKAIISSYDICTLLDASKNVPNIEGWPITKVAVLLVDSKKENCFLHSCSITDGAWSLIEKDVDASNQISEATGEMKYTYKKRRVIKKPSNDGLNEGQILPVGYSAAKEAAGVNKIDIMLLKSYTVYSQSKEKTASRFYIMKCSQPINEGFIQVPIKDLIERFQGPLVKRSSSGWKVTPVVEYFHVLPYSETISEWISRETFSNSFQDSKLEEKQFPELELTESHVSSEGLFTDLDNKPCGDTIEALNQKENNACSTIIQCGSIKEYQDMDADNSLVFPSKKKEECQKHISDTLQVNEDQKIENPSVQVNEDQKIENLSVQHQSNECTRPIGLDSKPCSDTIVALNKKENNACSTIIQCGSIKEYQDMDADSSLVFPSKNKEECQKHISDTLQVNEDQKIENPSVQVNKDQKIENPLVQHQSNECTRPIGLDSKPCSDTIVALNKKENNACSSIIHCGSIKEDQDMDADNSLVFPCIIKEECQKHYADTLQVNEDQKIENSSVQHHSNECTRPIGIDNKPCSDIIVAVNQKENNGCRTIVSCGSIKEDLGMDADNSSVFSSKNQEECQKHIADTLQVNEDQKIENPSVQLRPIGLDNKPCSDTVVVLNQKENNGCNTLIQCGSFKEDQDMDADNSSVFPSKIQKECQTNIADALQFYEEQNIENQSVQNHSNECTRPTEVGKVDLARMQITEGGIKDQSAFDEILADATSKNESIEKCTLIANSSNMDLEKIPISTGSKGMVGLSDVCPTVDAVKAFLEHLVDPMLPAKPSIRDDPPLSQQQKLAKQVHSVVLLYNYYHRRQHPELKFLAFKDFCKLIVDLRPALLKYMKFTQKPDETDLVDVEQQLSLTEKAITSSCDICLHLDASKNVPNIDGWPISKVAVLLVDSKEENCSLLFCSITDGVWSVIEKDVDSSNQISEVTNGIEHAYKKRRVIKKPTENGLNVDDNEFVQVGYSVVKEATGINSNDIMLLESYTVYSLSKEKTASRFYIMKSSQSTAEGITQVPIKDLIGSFRGPLLERSSSNWSVTSAVEYFHVLPYSEIISDWISRDRETFSNSLQESKLAEKQFQKLEVTESHVSSECMSFGLDNKPCSDATVALNQKENNGCAIITQCGSFKEDRDMDVDKDNSLVFPSKNKECKRSVKTLQVSDDQKIVNSHVPHHSNGRTSPIQLVEKVVSTRKRITEGGIKDQCAFDKISADTTFENEPVEKCTLIANNSNIGLEKIRDFIASKSKILSQTAVNALKRKRSALALQQRLLEDEIAVCNMKIQKWLIGEEDDLELKMDSIIEGCNGTWLRNQGRTCQYLEGQCLPLSVTSKRLTEAVLTLQSPHQELNGICHENNWIPPTYSDSQSSGGFQANVTVKGADFEYFCEGNQCSFPHEARDSAAAQMLSKLRSMAKSAR